VIVGVGALGSVQAELLARAGVGRLILLDRDILELHNLQRQLLFDEQQVRERLPKAVAAQRRLRAINSEITVECQVTDVTAANVVELIRGADVVLDGTDNFETRYVLNDAAVMTSIPWVYGGVLGTEGTVLAVLPRQGPCLRCVFPEPPLATMLPTCETAGVLASAVAWVAALQATLALKILLDAPLESALYALDVWHGSVTPVNASRNQDCACCAKGRFEFLSGERGSLTTVFCGRHAVQVRLPDGTAVDLEHLRQRLQSLGTVVMNGLILEFSCEGRRLVVFPDGRVLVMGTVDTAEARSLVSRFIGG